MARYFYLWTPYVIVGAVVLLALPWLGLIALFFVSVVALPALVLAIAAVPYEFVRAISRRWHTSPQTVVIPSAPMPRTTHQLQGADR